MKADVLVANPVVARYNSSERIAAGTLRRLNRNQWWWILAFAAGGLFAPIPGPWWVLLVSGGVVGLASLAVVMGWLERYLGRAYDRIYAAMPEVERQAADGWRARSEVDIAARITGRTEPVPLSAFEHPLAEETISERYSQLDQRVRRAMTHKERLLTTFGQTLMDHAWAWLGFGLLAVCLPGLLMRPAWLPWWGIVVVAIVASTGGWLLGVRIALGYLSDLEGRAVLRLSDDDQALYAQREAETRALIRGLRQ